MSNTDHNPTSLTANQRVEAVKYYQEYAYVHPLTCGNESVHDLLEAFVLETDPPPADVPPGVVANIGMPEAGDVAMRCPTCGYVQLWVPELVYSLYEGREEYEAQYEADWLTAPHMGQGKARHAIRQQHAAQRQIENDK